MAKFSLKNSRLLGFSGNSSFIPLRLVVMLPRCLREICMWWKLTNPNPDQLSFMRKVLQRWTWNLSPSNSSLLSGWSLHRNSPKNHHRRSSWGKEKTHLRCTHGKWSLWRRISPNAKLKMKRWLLWWNASCNWVPDTVPHPSFSQIHSWLHLGPVCIISSFNYSI